MVLLDGKKTSQEILAEISEEVKVLSKKGMRKPHLAAILVGENAASQTYVNAKMRACKKVGFESSLFSFDKTITESDLLKEIDKLNKTDNIDGFIVQLPLPEHINEQNVILAIDPSKDVDGFHPVNIGKMTLGIKGLKPATPAGILELLKRYNIETEGKHCVVIGRSNIVGMPISILLAQKAAPGNSTITICHSRTKNLEMFTKDADILIVAIGKREFVTPDMVKENAVVIDVGIHRKDADNEKGYVLKGDVQFDKVASKVSHITPVPGGVGPLTIASLLSNTLKAYNFK